jgi:hypothetical protein
MHFVVFLSQNVSNSFQYGTLIFEATERKSKKFGTARRLHQSNWTRQYRNEMFRFRIKA